MEMYITPDAHAKKEKIEYIHPLSKKRFEKNIYPVVRKEWWGIVYMEVGTN